MSLPLHLATAVSLERRRMHVMQVIDETVEENATSLKDGIISECCLRCTGELKGVHDCLASRTVICAIPPVEKRVPPRSQGNVKACKDQLLSCLAVVCKCNLNYTHAHKYQQLPADMKSSCLHENMCGLVVLSVVQTKELTYVCEV
mmetsp:Transcript_16467/g.41703  ORF Transcript_16467/g.41703 Transcript_16467/m.41703 type:complete len:146 (-) Transcript_16467:49-486(-)